MKGYSTHFACVVLIGWKLLFALQTHAALAHEHLPMVRAVQNREPKSFGPEDSVDSDSTGSSSLIIVVNSKTGRGWVAHHGYIEGADQAIIDLLRLAKNSLGALADLDVYLSGTSDRFNGDQKTLARRDLIKRALASEGFDHRRTHFAWLPQDHYGHIIGAAHATEQPRFTVHYWSRHQQWRTDGLQVTVGQFDSHPIGSECSESLIALL